MGRGVPKAARQIKLVIDILRQGPTYQSDLENTLFSQGDKREKKKIPHCSLHRILNDYLKVWGLVECVEDDPKGKKWIWRDLPHYESKYEYDMLLQHSRNLIPGIESAFAMLHLNEYEMPLLEPEAITKYKDRFSKGEKYLAFVLEHLATGYHDVFEDVVKHTELCMKNKGVQDRLRGDYNTQLENLMKENTPKSKIARITRDVKISVGLKRTVLSSDQYYNMMRERERKNQKTHEDYRKSCTNEEVLQRQLMGELSMLVLKIEEGKPLEGNCTLCPNIRIGDK